MIVFPEQTQRSIHLSKFVLIFNKNPACSLLVYVSSGQFNNINRYSFDFNNVLLNVGNININQINSFHC